MRRPALFGLLLLSATAGAAVESEPIRGLRAEVAALLMQGVAGGSLPIAAAVYPGPEAGAGAAGGLLFLLELPAAPAEVTEGGRPLEVYAYAIDGAGEVAAHYAAVVPDWPTAGEGLKVAGRLDTAPGALSLRFLAWDPTDRRYGLAVREISPVAAAAWPRIADECAGWSVAGGDAAELPGLSARPVLVSGETVRLSLGGPATTAGWRIRLIGGAGGEAVTETATVAVAEPGELEFSVPDLPAGAYRLSVAGAGSDTWSSPPLESWLVPVLPPADVGCRRSWPRVLRLARSGAPAAEPRPAPPAAAKRQAGRLAAAKRQARRLVADYEALLGRLAAAGDLTSAAAELAALEMPVVADDPNRIRIVAAAELEAVRSLAKLEPRCLLPLIALHAESYRVHHSAGRFPLATHSRRLAADVAELAAERLAEPEERALVSVALTGLADMVQSRRGALEAQRLLERALSLDESHEAARLLLAFSYERKGRYADARRQLEQLVSINSAHDEARVRLAILLRRIDEPAAAERLLRAVIAGRPPAWLLSLTYQTLAQLLIGEARLAEAVAALEDAGDRLPDDQALRVLLAYALDRGGERRRVQRTLAGLPLGAAAVTPRFRYSDEPPAALGLLRETWRQSVTVRLPVLAVALDARSPGGPAG